MPSISSSIFEITLALRHILCETSLKLCHAEQSSSWRCTKAKIALRGSYYLPWS
eukprot:UN14633